VAVGAKTIGTVAALALLIGARAATGASWDERVFSSHLDFDAVAAAGAAAIPDLIARGKALHEFGLDHRVPASMPSVIRTRHNGAPRHAPPLNSRPQGAKAPADRQG